MSFLRMLVCTFVITFTIMLRCCAMGLGGIIMMFRRFYDVHLLAFYSPYIYRLLLGCRMSTPRSTNACCVETN